jgi:hypothetical protein
VSLLSQPSYKALSYCWGVRKAREKAVINGCEVEITTNLDHALRQLQHENHGPLWIDALCINQNDTSERGRQVLRMGDIFSQATEVIAWLGPAEQDSDKAMLLMKSFRKYGPTMHMAPGGGPISAEHCDAEDTESWVALDKLLGRAYWERTWILQELTLAKQIIFRCGSESAVFRDLRGVDTIIARRARSPNIPEVVLKEAHLPRITAILGLRDLDAKKDIPLPLTSVLLKSREQLVTDMRDKVYGVLSIAADGLQIGASSYIRYFCCRCLR